MHGKVVDDVRVMNLGWKPNALGSANGEEQYVVFPHTSRAAAVSEWLQALSDGHVLLRKDDPYMKVCGCCFCGCTCCFCGCCFCGWTLNLL